MPLLNEHETSSIDILPAGGELPLSTHGSDHGSLRLLIAGLLIALLAAFTVLRAMRIVPQARARNMKRLGRYHRTLQPGLNFVIPHIDRVYSAIDLREQVVSFARSRLSVKTTAVHQPSVTVTCRSTAGAMVAA